MEQNKASITPDAIVVFPGGVMSTETGGWRSTTYEESDAFGTLGGRDRVEAGALLSKKYPSAYLVMTSPVYATELAALGVVQERILEGENSPNTQIGVSTALDLAQRKGWKKILLLSSEYHLPRIEAFYEHAKSAVTAAMISSESILVQADPSFAEYFEKVKKSPMYQRRLMSERRGIEAIQRGDYRPASSKDKQERPV
jgi:uncharacterized SAM-binding protein YcdF (DUF218 family)